MTPLALYLQSESPHTVLDSRDVARDRPYIARELLHVKRDPPNVMRRWSHVAPRASYQRAPRREEQHGQDPGHHRQEARREAGGGGAGGGDALARRGNSRPPPLHGPDPPRGRAGAAGTRPSAPVLPPPHIRRPVL